MADLGLRCLSYDTENWCWASVSEALARWYKANAPHSVCGVAELVLGHNDCCQLPTPPACDRFHDLDSALAVVGVPHQRTSGAVNQLVIRQQINQSRPLAAWIEWTPGQPGHFVLITGMETGSDLWIVDPQTGPQTPQRWNYQTFRDRYRDIGTWKATYTRI